MTVKEVRGRRRYIAFHVGNGIGKTALINRLRGLTGDVPYVVQCSDGLAILRCAPSEMDAVIGLMRSADPSWTSILTSGTLRTLREKIPGLAVARDSANLRN